MNYFSPQEIVEIATISSEKKAKYTTKQLLILSFMAGAYIAFGGLLAIAIGGGVPGIKAENPGIAKFLFGSVFPVGLMLVAIAGAELFTGNTAYFIPAVNSNRLKWKDLFRNWSIVYFGNFLGAIFLAYFITYLTGILSSDPWLTSTIEIALVKTSNPFYKTFLKGIGCNWLVCLAMWQAMAAKEIIGKIIGIWFPVMAFVALGFEHSIANMYFIPLAMFEGADITISSFIFKNLIPATLGNIIGGAFFVGGLYYKAYNTK